MGKLSSLIRENISVQHSAIGVLGASLSDVFVEEPVSLDVFVRDSRYLNNPVLSDIQYDAVRHIERVYYPNLYPLMALEFDSEYWAKSVRMINYANLLFAKGSGKDHVCRISCLRVAYLLLCLRSPQSYFQLASQDTIHLLNIASSSRQATEAFFKPMTEVVKRGWFKDRCEPKQNEIMYDKNVTAISGHSDAESQEGLNPLIGVADEIDAFRSKDELKSNRGKQMREPSRSAEAILNMLEGSASTRFPQTFKNVRLSYPRYQGSKIMLLHDEALADIKVKGDRSTHYASGPYCTWEVNPRYFKFEMISIPQTDVLVPNLPAIINQYEKDAGAAKGIFECRPSYAVDSYFRNHAAIRQCMSEEVTVTQAISVGYSLESLKSSITNEINDVWEVVYAFHPNFKPVEGARYCIHADMAQNGDKAGLAMSHVVSYEDVTAKVLNEDLTEDEVTYRKPILKTDFVIYYEADLTVSPQREIQIRWARQLIFELKKRGFNIARSSYDGFQSLESLQILESHGISVKKVSLDRDDEGWKTLRDVMYEGRIKMPYISLLFRELIGLGRFNGKIDHPSGTGSKDLADALAGSVLGAIEVGGIEEVTDELGHFPEVITNDPYSNEGFVLPSDYGLGESLLPIGFDISWNAFSSDNIF